MRITKPNKSNIPWYLKPFFWHQQRKYGAWLEPSMVWAQVPKLFLSVACLYGAVDRKRSPVSPALRSLITVRISQINWCAFCVDINSATLIKRAGSEAKVKALKDWRSSDIYSDKERAALEYAEQVTRSDTQVDDACFKQLKQHFDEQAIIDLTALIAFQNMSSKFNSALDISAQGFCQLNDDD